MITKIRNRPQVQQLSLRDFEEYLTQKNWLRVESSNANVLKFQGKQDIYGKPLTLVLPARKTLVDANRRLSDAIRSLSLLEEKPAEQIIQEIAIQGARRRAGIAATTVGSTGLSASRTTRARTIRSQDHTTVE